MDRLDVPDWGILPAQWYRKQRIDSWIVALAAAILDDGVRCYLRRPAYAIDPGDRDSLAEEAGGWIDDPGDRVFSFDWCVEVMGANPERIRRAIHERSALLFLDLPRRRHHAVIIQRAGALNTKPRGGTHRSRAASATDTADATDLRDLPAVTHKKVITLAAA